MALLKKLFFICFIALSLGSCAAPATKSYRDFYAHLNKPIPAKRTIQPSSCFIIFLVEARHLDYTDCKSLLRTMAKHPSDLSKNGDVGHAWIYLQRGNEIIEGGHSGELGIVQPKYLEGVMQLVDQGDPNPIRYVFETQKDGFFQPGSGGHKPTYALKVSLTDEQYAAILHFIESYDFSSYAITKNQCSSFLSQIGELIGFPIPCETSVEIDPVLAIGGEKIVFWSDSCYARLTISTPDIIEKSLMESVRQGKGEPALDWYLRRRERRKPWRAIRSEVCRFPSRLYRWLKLK